MQELHQRVEEKTPEELAVTTKFADMDLLIRLLDTVFENSDVLLQAVVIKSLLRGNGAVSFREFINNKNIAVIVFRYLQHIERITDNVNCLTYVGILKSIIDDKWNMEAPEKELVQINETTASDNEALDSDDDTIFFLAVLDIAMMEESDFELCRMYGVMMRELSESRSFTSLSETYPLFIDRAIDAFLWADISGGSYNEKALQLSDRLPM
jgi:hypothetical protein